jgi:hypothetical protein
LRDRFAAFFVDRFAVLFFALDRFAVLFLLDFFVAALAIAVVLSVPLLRARESLFPLTIENHQARVHVESCRNFCGVYPLTFSSYETCAAVLTLKKREPWPFSKVRMGARTCHSAPFS